MVRRYKRKTEDKWSKEDLLEALELITEKKCKINDISKQFGISRATLYRQFNKFRENGCNVEQFQKSVGAGVNQLLSKIEEDVLERVIIDLRTNGFDVTSSDIKRICFEYCDTNGIPNFFNKEKRMANNDWYRGFLKRHSKISICSDEDDTSTSEDCGAGLKKRKVLKKRKIGYIKMESDFIRGKGEPWERKHNRSGDDEGEILLDLVDSSPCERKVAALDESEKLNEKMTAETKENTTQEPVAASVAEGSNEDKENGGFAHEEEEAPELTSSQDQEEEETSIIEVTFETN